MRTGPPLRIAEVAPLWNSVPPSTYGGRERIVNLLTEELIKRGHSVTLYASGDSRTSAKLRPICERNMREAMQRDEAYGYEHYVASSIAEALRDRSSFDIIHFHLGSFSIPFGAITNTPTLHTIFTPPTHDDCWVLNQYPNAAIVVLSQSQVQVLPPKSQPKLRVIYNGCDFTQYEVSASPGQYLAFLARMGPQKSPHHAIQIAKSVGMPIVLAGEPVGDGERAYFNQTVKPLIDGKDVRHIGPVNDAQKREFLKHASALLFPIQGEEAFGIGMIEAMACGVPVVACSRGSVSEVIDFGKTGYYANSVEELPALVHRALLLDRSAIREHSAARFDHRVMTDNYLDAYYAVLDGAS